MGAGPCRVLETPLIMCERNCHGVTCTILLNKLNFLLAIFALEQGGKGGSRLRAVPYNKLKKFYVSAVWFFLTVNFWKYLRYLTFTDLQTFTGLLPQTFADPLPQTFTDLYLLACSLPSRVYIIF